MGKNRKYYISWNNYPPTLTLEELKEKIVKFAKTEYLILAFEKGEKKGTPHIQGYVRFKNPQHFKSVQKLFKNGDGTYGYFKEADGNDIQNAKYCKKQNNFIEYGTTGEEENKESFLNGIFEDIINEMNYKELCQKYWKYVLYHYKDFRQLYIDLKGLKAREDILKEEKEQSEQIAKWIKEKNEKNPHF